MSQKFGKHKIGKLEYERVRLQKEGGHIAGDVSFEGDIDVMNTISGSGGTFVVPGDFLFQTDNAGVTQNIIQTTDYGQKLSLHNNLIYSDGTNVGVGTTTPSARLTVDGNIVFSGLPTVKPLITGSLWLSGSAGNSSKYLVVFTG